MLRFSSSSPPRSDRLWGPISLLYNGYRGLLPRGQSNQGVNLTTHLHIVSRSIMCGAVSPLPNMPSWRGVHLREVEGQLHLYLYAISFFRYSFLTMVHRSCSTDMKLITVNKHLRIAVSTVFRQATLFNYLHSRILKQFTGLRFIRKPRNCYYYIDAFLKVLLFAILLCVPCTQRMQWSVK